MQVDGDPAQLVGLLSLALLVNLAATLWGVGMALRFQIAAGRAGDADPGVPDPVHGAGLRAAGPDRGWVHDAASYNPLTALLDRAAASSPAQPDTVGLAYLAGVGLVALGLVWALTGLRRAERGRVTRGVCWALS